MIVANVNNSDAVVIDLSISRIDASNSEDLYSDLARVLLKSNRIILDLSRLEVLDSSGLGLLLNCYREIKDNGGQMFVVANSPLVLSLFQLVHFNKIIKIYKTMERAIESLNVPSLGGANEPV